MKLMIIITPSENDISDNNNEIKEDNDNDYKKVDDVISKRA